MKKYILPSLLGTLVLLLASCHSDKKAAENYVMPVDVALPEVDSIVLHKSYPAYAAACDEADVVARVNGMITAKHFKDGQWVAAGAPLFSVETTTYADAVAKAEAALNTAIASNDYATKQYNAMKLALESDAVSRMDVIQAESNMRQSEASIRTARAALSQAKTQLGYCTIRAPFAGRVASAEVIVGSYVSGEGAPQKITTVVNDRDMKVLFSVEDAQYLLLTQTEAGKEVDLNHVPVQFGDSILKTYYGRMDYSSPTVDRSTGTIGMRLHLDNPDGELKSGMYATISLPYALEPKAILIKDASIGTDQLGKYVYLVNDSNRVVYNPIKVGELVRDTLRLVTAGLAPTDRYITKAMLKVRDKMTVKPVMAK